MEYNGENYNSPESKAKAIEIDSPIYIQAISTRTFKILTRRKKSYPYYIKKTGFITISIVEKAIAVKKGKLLPDKDEET